MKWKLSKADLKRMGLVNIHPESEMCHWFGCVVHHWSKHHMRAMPLHWRYDKGIFERICAHGLGHTDPDTMSFLIAMDLTYLGTHGCDGCCSIGKS